MTGYRNLRAYFFTNMYIQGIHAGIQAQHCTAEMFLKYDQYGALIGDRLYNWANKHRTTIILNGRDNENMLNILEVMDHPDNYFPWAMFKEPGLDNCITSIGIIVPEEIYKYYDLLKTYGNTRSWGPISDLNRTETEDKLAYLIHNSKLMV